METAECRVNSINIINWPYKYLQIESHVRNMNTADKTMQMLLHMLIAYAMLIG